MFKIQVGCQVIGCDIYCGRNGTGKGLSQYHFTSAPYSSSATRCSYHRTSRESSSFRLEMAALYGSNVVCMAYVSRG